MMSLDEIIKYLDELAWADMVVRSEYDREKLKKVVKSLEAIRDAIYPKWDDKTKKEIEDKIRKLRTSEGKILCLDED